MRTTQPAARFAGLVLFYVTFVLNVHGQLSIGISGGINYATCRFDDLNGYKPASTVFYFAGLSPEYSLNSKWSFLADVQFSQKGYLDNKNQNIQNVTVRFTYIDLLPQLEYRIQKHIGIGFGWYLGFRIKEDLKPEDMDWQKLIFGNLTKSIDYGLTGTIKGHFKNVSLFVRYNQGLFDISNLVLTDVNGQIVNDPKMHNQAIQAGIGYTFAIGKT